MKSLLLLLMLCAPLLLSQKAGKPAAAESLTFADEFDGSELDLSRWAPHAPQGGVSGRRLQSYAPDAVSVSGGQLHIVARSNGTEHVSGIVSTFGMFAQTYGRFEIRCKVPAGRGLRPEFVLLPVPQGALPAIDVFKTVGTSPSKVTFANRWGTEQTERSFGDSLTGPDLSAGFHTISAEWERDKITWLIDGKRKFESVDGIAHQPMYMLLDLVVEGDASSLPASFDIDYIRVYQRTSQ